MPKPSTLLKIKNIGIVNGNVVEIPLVGGSMRVSNQQYGTNKKNFLKVIKNDAILSTPSMKVGFVSKFDDLFGLKVTVTGVTTTSSSSGSPTQLQILVFDPMVTTASLSGSLKMYTVNIPMVISGGKQYITLNPGTASVELDLDNTTHVNFLVKHGTDTRFFITRSIDTIDHMETFDDLINSRGFSSSRSVSSNPVHKSKIFNDSVNFGTKISKEERISITPTNEFTNIDSGIPTKSKMYGPMTYTTIVMVDDLKNKRDPNTTRVIIPTTVRLEGIVLKDVISSESPNGINPGTKLVNRGSTLNFELDLSDKNVIFESNVSSVQLLETPDDIASSVLDFRSFTLGNERFSASSNVVTYDIVVDCTNVTTDYQGPISGYTQYLDVTWSPLTRYTPGIIFDTTNGPSSVDGYEINHVSSTDTIVEMKLEKFLHDTDALHTVTINAYLEPHRSGIERSVELFGVSRRDYNRSITLDRLVPNSNYYIEMVVDDGLNPVYKQDVFNVTTDSNDFAGPSISFTELVGHSDHIHLYGTVTDTISDIAEIRYMAMTIDGYNASFKNELVATQHTIMMQNGITINPSGPNFKSETFRTTDLVQAYTNNIPLDKINIESLTEYVVIIYSKDVEGNHSILKQNVTTYPQIQMISSALTIIDEANGMLSNVDTMFEFGFSKIDVLFGVYDTEPMSIGDIQKARMTKLTDVAPNIIHKFDSITQTVDLNNINDNETYYLVYYTTAAGKIDEAYNSYANIVSIPYTKLDRGGPVIRDVSVNFDVFL